MRPGCAAARAVFIGCCNQSELSPRARTVAKPDKAETSDIAALAGFALDDALSVCEEIPACVFFYVLPACGCCARADLPLHNAFKGRSSEEQFTARTHCFREYAGHAFIGTPLGYTPGVASEGGENRAPIWVTIL